MRLCSNDSRDVANPMLHLLTISTHLVLTESFMA